MVDWYLDEDYACCKAYLKFAISKRPALIEELRKEKEKRPHIYRFEIEDTDADFRPSTFDSIYDVSYRLSRKLNRLTHSSIQMKMSNIKHISKMLGLCDGVDIGSLSQYSMQNLYAFICAINNLLKFYAIPNPDPEPPLPPKLPAIFKIVGAKVLQERYGEGVVTEFKEDGLIGMLTIDFNGNTKMFQIPIAFDRGLKFLDEEINLELIMYYSSLVNGNIVKT